MAAAITILAALGAGVFGAWLTAWNQRRERFRDRMIDAADDYATSVAEALQKVRDLTDTVRLKMDSPEQLEAALLVYEYRDKVMARSSRIDLLFGPGSASSGSTGHVIQLLADVAELLQPPDQNLDAAEKKRTEAANEHERFYSIAREEIRLAAAPTSSVGERLRLIARGQ